MSVCCLDTCFVAVLHSVSVCKRACVAIARVFGEVVHISFWCPGGLLLRCSSGVLVSEAAPLERC